MRWPKRLRLRKESDDAGLRTMIDSSAILDAGILVVDDLEANILLLEQILHRAATLTSRRRRMPARCASCTAGTATT